jgi:DNA-3-methyladenine glycosylase II
MAPRSFRPTGPYDLARQSEFFGGWPALDEDGAIVVAFPIEGWQGSAAVVVRQDSPEALSLDVFGAAAGQADQAVAQVLATLSLDVNADTWPDVGRSDEQIGKLQAKYGFLRPVLFCSPYESAAHFIIGHRISMKQGRAIRARMAEELGTKIDVQGETFAAFPDPSTLLTLSEFQGLNSTKIERLHGVAEAALAGTLDRSYLRQLPAEDAMRMIMKIDGIGPFFASGIVNRGAGLVDDVTDDDLTKYAVRVAYGLAERPDQAEVLRIAEKWRPYRMWAVVLLHVWLRREVGLPRRGR